MTVDHDRLSQLLAGDAADALTAAQDVPARTAAILADRGRTELLRGRPLALGLADGWLLVAAVDTLGTPLLQRLTALGQPLQLLLSAERLQALGLDNTGSARALAVAPGTPLTRLQELAAAIEVGADDVAKGGAPGNSAELARAAPGVLADTGFVPPPSNALSALANITSAAPAAEEADAWVAALTLCKRARLVPAVLALRLSATATAALAQAQVLCIAAAALGTERTPQAPAPRISHSRLRRISSAPVPLALAEHCRLVLFREADGDAEHLAILVGQPPQGAPVPVRLHSACLTGDLLGSLRCDCGPQLQRAVARLAETGGVLLYLAQEGRSTGLANKLRAYGLQDQGLDTLQADRYLGFREDERDFSVAAAMLLALGHTRIQLLTNNPQKIAALRRGGIDVVERLPLHGQVNSHNERYIRTKQQAGHYGGVASASSEPAAAARADGDA